MANQNSNVPMRKTSSGMKIDTRPMYIEEWLQELPYIDFKKTSLLLEKATGLTNDEDVKPSTRLELLELYGQPYQYYIDSQIKAGAQQTLQSIETAQEQVRVLKKIAINLAKGCKLAAEDSIRKKSLFKQQKPPLTILLYSLNYLSHALIFSYLEYATTSKNIWREINFIFKYAESLKQENIKTSSTDSLSVVGVNTISGAYKRIVFSSLADPHHLPYGAIWEIYGQLNDWTDLIQISTFKIPEDDNSCFVINLDSDESPIPYSKFNVKRASDKHRLINGNDVCNKIQEHLKVIETSGRPSKSLSISPYFSKMILEHLSVSWSRPPKRKNPRKERKGKHALACGMNDVYYFLNEEKEFKAPRISDSDDQGLDYDEDTDDHIHSEKKYKTDVWEMIDQSAQGFAVIRNLKPVHNIKVGELIIIDTKKTERRWAVGTVRWLMINDGNFYKIGVQIISTASQTAAIRACSGSAQDTRFRRALILNQGINNSTSIITSKGMFIKNREIEINFKDKNIKVNTIELLESTTGFEQFSINKRLKFS